MQLQVKARVGQALSSARAYGSAWLHADNGAAVFFACLGLLLSIPIISNHVPASGAASAGLWLVAALLSLYFSRNVKLEKPFFFLVLFVLYVSFATCISNQGDFAMLFTRLAALCGGCLFAFSDRAHFPRTAYLFSLIIIFFLAIDIASMLLFPQGIYDTGTGPSWILGYKNLRTPFLVFLIAVFAVRFCMQCSKGKLAALVAVGALSVLDLLLCDSSSGVAGLMLEGVLIAFACILPQKAAVLRHFWVFLALYVVVFFALVVFRENDLIRNFLAVVFSKDASLSGRTAIWNSCLFAVGESGMLGLGALSAPGYFTVTGGFYNAHNLIVDLALLGGIPGVALYFGFMGTKMSAAAATQRNMPLVCAVYAVLIMGVVSGIFTYSSLFYYLLFSIEGNNKELSHVTH